MSSDVGACAQGRPTRLSLSSFEGWLSLAILLIVFFSAAASRVIIGPMQEVLVRNLKLSDLDIAWVQGPVISLPGLILSIPVGYLADRISRPRLMIGLIALNLIGCLFVASAAGFTGIVIGRAISSVPMTITPIIGLAYVADLFDPSRLGRVNSVLTIGITLGASATFSLGGTFLGLTHSAGAWRWLAVILAGLLAIALLGLLQLDDGLRRSQRSVHSISAAQSMDMLWRSRRKIGALVIGTAIMVIPEYGAIVWAPAIFARDHGLTVDQVGHLLGLTTLLGGVTGIAMGGVLADFFYRPTNEERLRPWLLGILIATLPCLLFGLPASTALSFLLLLFLLILCMLASVLLQVQAAVILPVDIRGTALSLLTAAAALVGPGVGALGVGLEIGHRSGPHVIGTSFAVVCTIPFVIGIAALLPLSRHLGDLTEPSQSKVHEE